MKATLDKAFGYQGDNMNLPVRDLAAAVPFYETVLGFRVLAQDETPHKAAVLARDRVQMRLTENGGDPMQDGCAFHVTNLEALRAEFQVNSAPEQLGEFKLEQRDGSTWKVFFVVAPDGLCYWFGERQTAS